MAPIMNCLKKGELAWSNAVAKLFVEIKARMVSIPVMRLSIPVMRLSDFSKIFEVTRGTSNIGIGGVLAQEGHPIAYFSKKLNDSKQKYSIYDKKFHAVIQALRYWQHYLLPQEFVLFYDHEILKYIYSQKKLNA